LSRPVTVNPSIGQVTQGGTISRYLNLLDLRIDGLRQPGDQPGVEPNGIAVTPTGVIYLDSFEGNGWAGGTSLDRVTGDRTLAAVPIRTRLLNTLPPLGAPGFSPLTYPTPTSARGIDLFSCPSSEGLEPFNATAVAAARASARSFNAYTSSFYGDRQSSDRSWWLAADRAAGCVGASFSLSDGWFLAVSCSASTLGSVSRGVASEVTGNVCRF
jgi:hypothetical protein